MGSKQSVFTPEELDDYKKYTYLNEQEILKCFENFGKLAGKSSDQAQEIKKARIELARFKKSSDFSFNPFADRIFKVFATSNKRDPVCKMSFEDYLNMMSVFSEAAPAIIKSRYAFEIYDFRDKEYLEREDIKTLIQHLIGDNKFSSETEEMNRLIDQIFEEADIDQNKKITVDEFEHIVTKSIDFNK